MAERDEGKMQVFRFMTETAVSSLIQAISVIEKNAICLFNPSQPNMGRHSADIPQVWPSHCEAQTCMNACGVMGSGEAKVCGTS